MVRRVTAEDDDVPVLRSPRPSRQAGMTWFDGYADPGEPPRGGPWRYLWWLITAQPRRIVRGAVFGSLWMIGLVLPPQLVSEAVDRGLQRNDFRALLLWTVALFGVGVFTAWCAIMRHRTMTWVRLDAVYRTMQVVTRHSVHLGSTLSRRTSAHEVVTVGVGDVGVLGQTLTVSGPGLGGLIAYGIVAVLLFRISIVLALVVLLGVPLLLLIIGPLLTRLHARQARYREVQADLTARIGDVVGGLGVLAALGGRELVTDRYRQRSADLVDEGYRVGSIGSWVQALALGLPSIFVAIVVWLSARMAAEGTLTIGQLVAVYGYTVVLSVPVAQFLEAAYDLTGGIVAARRVVQFLALDPADDERSGKAPAEGAPLYDAVSGLRLDGSGLTALVSAEPTVATGVAERLAGIPDTAGGGNGAGVAWGDQRMSDVPRSEIRRRILLAENEAFLFAGSLREVLAGREARADSELMEALHTAAAEDVSRVLGGLDGRVETGGRNLSGGQQQRVRMARAVLAATEVLIAVEPTSALDVHTEARLIQRVRERRADRTTLIIGTSAVLLDHADTVCFLVNGTVAASGTHQQLLISNHAYRQLVSREVSEETIRGTGPGSDGRQR